MVKVLLLLLFFMLTGCKSEATDEEIMIRITLENQKTIDVELYEDVAPVTVKNFLKLVDEKYYDGVCFHRIIKDFMVQTGGYYLDGASLLEKEQKATIKGEFASNGFENNLAHEVGVISMARSNDVNSASSQFFICTAKSPHLDGVYAAFGKVVDDASLANLMELNEVATINIGYGFTDFPENEIKIESIRRIK